MSPGSGNSIYRSDSDEDLTDKGRKKKGGFKWKNLTKADLSETDDEIGRIHWKYFSTDRFEFEGKVTTRKESCPSAGRCVIAESLIFAGTYFMTGWLIIQALQVHSTLASSDSQGSLNGHTLDPLRPGTVT